MEKLISIITLTYNSKDLKPTIDSVLMQDYPRIQYIISDDCSSNLDLDYWEKYINDNKRGNIEQVLILRSEKNQGIIGNANKARRAADGDYLFMCSHDDQFYDSAVITDWVKAFEETGADVVTAKREVCDNSTNTILGYAPSNRRIKFLQKCTPSQLFKRLAIEKNFIIGASTANTKECISKYGEYDEKYRHIEDYPMMLKIARNNGSIKYLDRVVLKYQIGGISSASNVNKKYFDEEESIVRNEILPYVRFKPFYMFMHKFWVFRMTLKAMKNRLLRK